MSDEKANIFKVQKLPGRHGRIYGRHKQEGRCALPGEVCMFSHRLGSSRGDLRNIQKSAEGIVGP